MLARRAVVICDEHQDATFDQHQLVAACLKAGSRIRIFGDPMQAIYATSKNDLKADGDRWARLRTNSNSYEELDIPHRWLPNSKTLGEWILRTRIALRDGGQVDISSGLPDAVSFIVGENASADPRRYSLSGEAAKQLYNRVNRTTPLLIVTPHNETARALRALFNRSIPIWEGHMRSILFSRNIRMTRKRRSWR